MNCPKCGLVLQEDEVERWMRVMHADVTRQHEQFVRLSRMDRRVHILVMVVGAFMLVVLYFIVHSAPSCVP